MVLFIAVKVFGWYLKLITLHPVTPLSCNNAKAKPSPTQKPPVKLCAAVTPG